MSAGAGVAGLAAIIASETGVGGIAGGVIAGVLAIGAGLLGSCAANGTGVIVDVSWAGVPWCVAQTALNQGKCIGIRALIYVPMSTTHLVIEKC